LTTISDTHSGTMDAGTDPVDGPGLDASLDAILAVVNGGLDNTNIATGAAIATTKLDTGVLTHWLGASTAHKVIFGTKSVTLDNTIWNGGGIAAVDFTTDGDTYGSGAATDFSAAPIIVLTPLMAEGASPLRYTVGYTAPATTGFNIVVMTTDVAASTASVTVSWLAIGAA
jgi:hypothetical protein